MTLSFGLAPHTDDAPMHTALEAMVRLWSQASGLSIAAKTYGSPLGLALAFKERAVDLAWTSPTLLLEEPFEDAVPLLSVVREGVAQYHSVVFTKRGANLHDPRDLAGTAVAWVAKTSAAGYIVPRVALARAGVDVASFRDLFVQSHAAVAWAVMEGRAAAGATYALFERHDPSRALLKSGFSDFVPELDARVLVTAGPIPSDMIVAQPALGSEQGGIAAAALAHLATSAEGSAPLRVVMNAEGFEPFSESAMGELRTLLSEARAIGRR
jgi:phosphonate transport system substrate-binding protein